MRISRVRITSGGTIRTSRGRHWRVNIDSKITGISVPTELVDLLDVGAGKIASLIEFFVPI